MSLSFLPFHRSEEERGRADCGGVLQTPKGEAQIPHCMYFWMFNMFDMGCVISRWFNHALRPRFARFLRFPICPVVWLYLHHFTSISSENKGLDSGIISYSDFISSAYRTNPIKKPSPSLKRQPNWEEQIWSRQPWAKSEQTRVSDYTHFSF